METKSTTGFDHSSHSHFLEYYAEASLKPETVERFRVVRDKLLLLAERSTLRGRALDVADIGCGAGTQCQIWSELGHQVHGIDVNEPLILVARERAKESGYDIRFDVGTATSLPYADQSMDVVLLPELLEHVADWQGCLNEAVRILRPNGLLYLSTTSYLCPRQQEFNLPFYGWYPAFVKRRYERLAVTSRPELANFARYPAVNWFSFPMLSDYLRARGIRCLDRFDMMERERLPMPLRPILSLIRIVAPLRWVSYLFVPHTIVFGMKHG